MNVAARIFLVRMGHGLMRLKGFANLGIEAAFVGMQTSFAGNVVCNDVADRMAISVGNVERANIPAALNQRDNRAFA